MFMTEKLILNYRECRYILMGNMRKVHLQDFFLGYVCDGFGMLTPSFTLLSLFNVYVLKCCSNSLFFFGLFLDIIP